MYEIHLISTCLMLASILAFPVFKVSVERTFQFQLILVCIADIYASGAALGFTCLFGALTRPLTIPVRVLCVWGAWGAAIVAAMWSTGYTTRTLFQVVELYYYLAIVILSISLARQEESRRQMLWGLTIGGFILALSFIAMPILYSDNWSAGLRGRNEGSFVLVFAGIIAPLALSFRERGRIKWGLHALAILSVAATFAAESRASSLFGCAVLSSVASVQLLGLSAIRFALLSIALAGLAAQNSAVQDSLDSLLDTERNFSNIERLTMIDTCIELFYEKPLTGWGWGTLEVLLPRRSHTQLEYPHPHNTYAHFAAELGFLGLVGLTLLYSFLGEVALENYRARRAGETVFVALSGAALVTMGLVSDYFYGGSRGVIVAVILGISLSYARPSKKPVTRRLAQVQMHHERLRHSQQVVG